MKHGLSLSDLLEGGLACGIIGFDADRRIIAVNTEVQGLLAQLSPQLLRHSIEVLDPPLREVIAESFATQRSIPARQIDLQLRSGTQRLAVATLATFHVSSSGVALIAVLVDMTAAVKLDDNLRRLNQLASIGTLGASMAHEIKNALVAIKTFFDASKPESGQSGMEGIVGREIERINSIVGQMLKASSATATDPDRVQIHGVIDQTLRLMQHQFAEKQIQVHRGFYSSHNEIEGKEFQLEQVFINLFLNAIAAMQTGGDLRISTEMKRGMKVAGSPGQLLITISDSGTGMPPEILAEIFEPFFTTKADGTGLGLPITRRIIEEHRGTITVESETGRGTTFHIELPVLG